MKKLNSLFYIIPITLLIACGGNEEVEDEKIDVEKNPLGALIKMGKNMEKQAKKMEEKQKNHKDAKAMHYEELIKFLPESVSGFTMDGETNGGSIDMSGMSYSSAEVNFKNEAGDRIHVTLLDYNAAFSMYSMATAMWSTGMKIDTKEEFAQSINFNNNINGWESIKKNNGKASLVLGVGDRFLLTIDGDNQEDCNFLKEIAKSMDLEELAALD